MLYLHMFGMLVLCVHIHKFVCCFCVCSVLPHIWLCLFCHLAWGQRVGLPRDLYWLFPRPNCNDSPRTYTILNTTLECSWCLFLLVSYFSFTLSHLLTLCYWVSVTDKLSVRLTWIPEYAPSSLRFILKLNYLVELLNVWCWQVELLRPNDWSLLQQWEKASL